MKENRGRNLSMWALLARSSFYKILAVLLLMVIAEVGLFYIRRQEVYAMYGISALHVGMIFQHNKMKLLFLTALGFLFLILFWTENRLDSKSRYTIMRLRITEQQFFGLKTIYNVLCLLLIYVVQICLVFWMVWKCKADVNLGESAPQVYFFAFYSNRFLHCLLPMAEIGKWVRNVLTMLAWGMQAAGTKGKSHYVLPVWMFYLTIFGFESDMGVNPLDILCYIVSVIIIGKEILCMKYRKLA